MRQPSRSRVLPHGATGSGRGSLGTWLDEHPDAHVTALCPRLTSARWRYLLSQGLSAGAMLRVRLRAVADPEYDETNWWQHKHGLLNTFNNLVGYAHVRLCGESQEKPRWDPDEYEKSLLQPH